MEIDAVSLNCVYHNDWLSFLYRLQWGPQAKPGNYFALLCDGAALGPSSSVAAIVAQELSGDGYARQAFAPDVAGALSGGRWVGDAAVSWTVTAAKQWQYLVVLANATSAPGNTTGTPVFVGTLPAPETIVAASPRAITITVGGLDA